MIWNNPHQQPSKESMKTSVKIQHTLKARRMKSCRNFLQVESLVKIKARKRTIGKGGEDCRIFLLSSLPISLYKEKRKVKDIFDFLGRNYTIVLLFSTLLNSFIYTSRQLQTLDIPCQLNINS